MTTKTTLIQCRKCGVYPKTDAVKMDGKMQRKVYCPQCGLAVYVPQGVTPSAAERWNGINETRRLRPDVTAPRRSTLVTEAALGAFLAEPEHHDEDDWWACAE